MGDDAELYWETGGDPTILVPDSYYVENDNDEPDTYEQTKFLIDESNTLKMNWCYSAKELQKLFKDRFEGKRLKGVYITLGGYLNSFTEKDYIDLANVSGYCNLIIGNELLELELYCEGQICYRIIPMDGVKVKTFVDVPEDEYYYDTEYCNDPNDNWFNINGYLGNQTINEQIINDIVIEGTNVVPHGLDSFESHKAGQSASAHDLPTGISFVTDSFTLSLTCDRDSFYILELERTRKQ